MSSPAFSFYTPSQSTTTSLFTPNHYSPTSPLSFSYIPQTPSPLRTSRNANLMPPLPTPTSSTKSSPLASTENVWKTGSVDENTFNFLSSVSTSNPLSKESSFSRRSRSQSPITELGSRTSAARDRRKSLFLEQIRTKREDEKFEARGDQLLRMDWVREEAERKARLGRQAQRLTQLQTELDEDDMMLDEAQDAPSPSEDRELEELIKSHEELQRQGTQQDENMMDDDFGDEDYDQLFTDVISAGQEQPNSISNHQNQQHGSGQSWPHQEPLSVLGTIDGGIDESMDIS